MKRDIFFYKNKAKERTAIKSDRKLSKELGLSENAMTQFCTGRAFPSDDTMIRLSEMAGIDPMIALIDLNTWRTRGFTQKTYMTMGQRLAQVALTLVIMGIPALPVHAEFLSSDKSVSIYYGN